MCLFFILFFLTRHVIIQGRNILSCNDDEKIDNIKRKYRQKVSMEYASRLREITKEIRENYQQLDNKERNKICKAIKEMKEEFKEETSKLAKKEATKTYMKKMRKCEACNKEYTIGCYYAHVKTEKHKKRVGK